jgi:hypothetical protein
MKYHLLLASFGLLLAGNCFAATVVVPGENGANIIVGVDDSHLEKQVSYKWGTDPFYKTPGFVRGTIAAEPILELKGVLHGDDDESSAIINKKTVHVNSVVDGYAVREIGDNYVIVQKGDSLRELQLRPIQNRSATQINVYDRLPAMEEGTKTEVKK